MPKLKIFNYHESGERVLITGVCSVTILLVSFLLWINFINPAAVFQSDWAKLTHSCRVFRPLLSHTHVHVSDWSEAPNCVSFMWTLINLSCDPAPVWLIVSEWSQICKDILDTLTLMQALCWLVKFKTAAKSQTWCEEAVPFLSIIKL